MRRPSLESRPRSLHCTQRKTGALKYAEKGATSRLERGVGVHPLVCGASTFPWQLPQPPLLWPHPAGFESKGHFQGPADEGISAQWKGKVLLQGGDRTVGVRTWAGLWWQRGWGLGGQQALEVL